MEDEQYKSWQVEYFVERTEGQQEDSQCTLNKVQQPLIMKHGELLLLTCKLSAVVGAVVSVFATALDCTVCCVVV